MATQELRKDFHMEYWKMPGKRWGLHCHNIPKALRDEIVSFVNYNIQWRDAPHQTVVKAAHPFFQSDTWQGGHNDYDKTGYVFIEMWAPTHAARLEFIELLQNEVINNERGAKFEMVHDVLYIPEGRDSEVTAPRAAGGICVMARDLASLLSDD